MGDGLQRATMAALLTRGPWLTIDAKGHAATLTAAQVEALYAAIPDPARMAAAVGAENLSDRRSDRALQLLRRAGLIRFDRASRAWVRADDEVSRG